MTTFNSNWNDKEMITWDGLYVTLAFRKYTYIIMYDLIFDFICISAIFIKTNTLSSSKRADRIVMSFKMAYK